MFAYVLASNTCSEATDRRIGAVGIPVFDYNEKQPDIVKLKLSDAFQIPDDTGEFEWTARMLNINYGHNQRLLEQCQPLYEYAHFIKLVREYSQTMNLKEAIDKAVETARDWECIGTFLY